MVLTIRYRLIHYSFNNFYLSLGLPVLLSFILNSFLINAFNLKECLESHKIYPDVIDSVPESTLEVKYGDKEITIADKLKFEDVKNKPHIEYAAAEKNSLYTIFLTDPDAPYEYIPYIQEKCYWFVGNIDGSNLNPTSEYKSVVNVVDYQSPEPSYRKGPQTYVFLVYKQPKILSYADEKNILIRVGESTQSSNKSEALKAAYKFRADNIAEKYNLGLPKAINFFIIDHPGFKRPNCTKTDDFPDWHCDD